MAVQGTIKRTAPSLRLLVGTLFVVLFCREGCSARLRGAAWGSTAWQTGWIPARVAGFQGRYSLSPNQQFTRKQHNQLCLPAGTHHGLWSEAACWPDRWWAATECDPITARRRSGHTEGSEHCSKLKALPVIQHRTLQCPAAFLCSGCDAPFTSKPHLVQPFFLPAPIYFQGLLNATLS